MRRFTAVAVAGVMCGLCVSCVRSKPMDYGVIGQYQQALAERGPQDRQCLPAYGQSGVGLLQPTNVTRPPLNVVTTGEKAIVELGLEEAIHRTLANSLDIRLVSYDPSISYEELQRALAEFDAIAFGSFLYQKDDLRTDSVLRASETINKVWTAGVRQRTITGGTWELSHTFTRNWSSLGLQNFRTQYEPVLQARVVQPLLRNAWSDFNLANIRIARLNYRSSMQEFRAQTEETVNEVINTYWALVQAQQDVEIQDNLLKLTRETLERVKGRATLDATEVEVKQTEAAVEQRYASLIRAQKVAYDTQDALSRLLADKQLNLMCDYDIKTTTPPVTDLVQLDLADQILTALRCNPVMEQARLAISVSEINVRIARNQLLPVLNLVASGSLQGLGASRDSAYDSLGGGDYASYTIGAEFEYPLGNRAAEADLRRFRLERLRALTQMQNVADQLAVSVKERIRQVNTTFQEIKAQRASVEASKAQLFALEQTEQNRGRLTPEFLQVKLNAQEALANAQRSELRAVVAYNQALADLARITGCTLELHQVKLAMPAVINEE